MSRRKRRAAHDQRFSRYAFRIVEAKGFDLGPDIVNLENGGLDLRLANETAGFLAAFDQTGLGELAHDLVHGHARTVILIG